MQKVVRPIYWQWTFLLLAAFLIFFAGEPLLPGTGDNIQNTEKINRITGITGQVILESEDTDIFAPPYDAFTGRSNIQLTHNQVSNNSFHINIDISQRESMIYSNIYYYTNNGWQSKSLAGSTWIKASATTGIDEEYTNFQLRDGDDFFVGIWICKADNLEWKCGCKNPSDCGYWHIQGIDLESEGQSIITCEDSDGDGYGIVASEACFYPEQDCDDTDLLVNPGETEIVYNNKDDDCNTSTVDDDIDKDGFILADDCDDTKNTIYPAANTICENGIDEDCDTVDELCNQCGEGGILSTGCRCQDAVQYSGYCCDNIFQGTPCGTPEVIFYDGFESGTLNTWEYANPNAEANNDKPHIGSKSFDLIYNSGTLLKKNIYANTNLVGEEQLFHRFYLYIEEDFIQVDDGVELFLFGTENDWAVILEMKASVGDESKGALTMKIAGANQAVSKILNRGQWYCIEEEVKSTDGEVRLWVDNSLVLEQTGITDLTGNVEFLRQGGLYSGLIEDAMHLYVDDLVVSRMRVGC